MSADLYIGLMSGTSLDGVDAVLLAFDASGQRTLGTHYLPYPEEVKQEALLLHEPGQDELHRTAQLAQALSRLYASACRQLLEKSAFPASAIKAIGCHGQTVRHRPESGYTLQIGNPALLAELTGIAVIADFRSRDIAAGGQGAPLVPAVHVALFQSSHRHRALLNLGGIANITNLPSAATEGQVTGFDCGPANMLLDAWVLEQRGEPFDEEGQWARSGTLLPDLLRQLMDHPFLRKAPPKSCGREEFNLAWLKSLLTGKETPADIQATLLEFTCRTSSDALKTWCKGVQEVFVCGGGARNTALMDRLASHLPHCRLTTTADLGIPPDWVEAVAFAWLARQHMLGLPGNLPSATGAKGPRILGAYYPA